MASRSRSTGGTSCLDLPVDILQRILEAAARESNARIQGVSGQVSLIQWQLVCRAFRRALLDAPFLFWSFDAAVDELNFHNHVMDTCCRTRTSRITLVVAHPVNLRSVLQTAVMSTCTFLETINVQLRGEASPEGGTNMSDPLLWQLFFKLLQACKSLRQVDVSGPGFEDFCLSNLHIQGLNISSPFVQLAELRLQGVDIQASSAACLLGAMPVLRVLEIEAPCFKQGGRYELVSETLLDLVWVEEGVSSRPDMIIDIRCRALKMLNLESWACTATHVNLWCPSLEELRLQTLPHQSQILGVSHEMPLLRDVRVCGRSWSNVASVLLACRQLRELSLHEVFDFPPFEQVSTFCNSAGVRALILGSTICISRDGSSNNRDRGCTGTLSKVVLWAGPTHTSLELCRIDIIMQVCVGLETLIVVCPDGAKEHFVQAANLVGSKYNYCQIQVEG